MFREALERAQVPLHMLEKYVDEVNVALRLVDLGFEWVCDGGVEMLRWSEEG